MSNSDYKEVSILLVEDEEQVADAISAILVSIGHDVAACHSLDQTEKLIQREENAWKPDVLLTDDRLPQGKNALDIISCVHRKYKDLPVLVITGNTSPERLTTLQNSNLKVIFKPVSSKNLIMNIQDLLNSVKEL